MNATDLTDLFERQRIVDTMTRYAVGIDLHDWDLLGSALAEHLEVDFTSWGGGRDLSLFTTPKTMRGGEWVDGVRSSMGAFKATHHLLGNSLVEQGADTARCTMHVQAHHYLPNDRGDNEFTLGGYYDNRLRRDPIGEWKIERLKLVVLWCRGNRFVFELAYQAGVR